MKILFTYCMILAFFFSFSYCVEGMELKQDEQNKRIIGVFNRAIELNENYKHEFTKKEQSNQRGNRSELEKYYEEVVLISLKECIIKLSSINDEELAISLFHLILSFSNSADENLSDSLAQLFVKNNELIEKIFNKFNQRQKKQLYEVLNIGWQNYIFNEKMPIKKIKYLQKKINELETNAH